MAGTAIYSAVVMADNGDIHAHCGHEHRSAAAAERCQNQMLRHHPVVRVRSSADSAPHLPHEESDLTVHEAKVQAIFECLVANGGDYDAARSLASGVADTAQIEEAFKLYNLSQQGLVW